MSRLVLARVALVLGALGGSACAHVPSYARGRLAHPTMASDFSDSAARAHRDAVQEGAVGGVFGASSGCGCN